MVGRARTKIGLVARIYALLVAALAIRLALDLVAHAGRVILHHALATDTLDTRRAALLHRLSGLLRLGRLLVRVRALRLRLALGARRLSSLLVLLGFLAGFVALSAGRSIVLALLLLGLLRLVLLGLLGLLFLLCWSILLLILGLVVRLGVRVVVTTVG